MKKYILDKNDVFGKNVLIANGSLNNFDNKLNISVLVSKGILLYGKDTLPKETYMNLSVVTSASLLAEIIFFITDFKRREKARKKVLRLIEELNSKGYDISNEYMPMYSCFEKGISSLLFCNGTSVNYVDGEYNYVDLKEVEKNIKEDNCSLEKFFDTIDGSDITDCVYKIMLSEKKYKKYKKSKQNK